MTTASRALLVVTLVLLGPGAALRAQPPDDRFEGRPVVEVAVVGNERISDEAVRVAVRTREGAALSAATLDGDVKRLYDLGFYEVEAFAEERGEGVAVRFEVKENARVANVRYEGMEALELEDLDTTVQLRAGQFASDMALEIITRDLQDEYERRGYLFANVKALKRGTPEGIDVTFRVVEGRRVAVRDIKVVGNRHLSSKQLRKIMRTRSSGTFRRRYLDLELLDQDVIAIRNWYRAEGYRDVQVELGDIWFNQARNRASITLLVNEGIRYRVRDIRIEGNALFADEELRTLLELEPGDFLLQRVAERDRGRILRRYGQDAYIDAEVAIRPYWDDREPGVADVVYRITEGDKVYLGKLRIEGNRLTKGKVIRREISLYPGDPIDFDEVRRSYNRLAQSGYFDPASVAIEPEDTPGNAAATVRDYVVRVKEGQTGFVRFAVGVGSNSGIIGDISLIKRNFDITDFPSSFADLFAGDAFTGAGQTLTLQVSPGTELSRFRIAFEDPFVFDTKNSLDAELFRRIRLRFDYDETRQGGRLAVGRHLSRFKPDLAVRFQVRGEQIVLDDFERDASQDAFDFEGRTNLLGMGPSIVYRRLDAPLAPTRGVRAELGYELIGNFLGGDVDMNRVTGEARSFFPIHEDVFGRHHVVSIWTRLGWSEATRDTDRVPIFERFFAGGRESIRGFEFRGVGPHQNGEPVGGDVLAIGGAEYEFPLLQEVLRGTVFLDGGTVAESVHADDFSRFRLATGFGFRLKLPFFGEVPLALDFGFPIFEQDEDETQVVSFSLGSPFFGF